MHLTNDTALHEKSGKTFHGFCLNNYITRRFCTVYINYTQNYDNFPMAVLASS